MKVHYKLFFPILILVFGSVSFILNLFLIGIGAGFQLQVLFGIILLIVGIVYLKKPIFELRENEIVLFNGFGMIVKRYEFASLDELVVVNNKVYLEKDGQRKRVRVSGAIAKKDEWDAFIQKIGKRTYSSDSDLLDDV